jgi:hypothetical protein
MSGILDIPLKDMVPIPIPIRKPGVKERLRDKGFREKGLKLANLDPDTERKLLGDIEY